MTFSREIFVNTNRVAFLGLIISICTSISPAANATTRSRCFAPPIAKGSGALQMVRTFDGQSKSCVSAFDLGQVAYRRTCQSGVIEAGNVDITMDFETLKCAEKAGVFAFEKSALDGRHINRFQGFLEFTGLDMVAYTADLKVNQAKAVSLKDGDHSVTFSIPAASLVGLLPRNVKANDDYSVVVVIFLRGFIQLGDARTGTVKERNILGLGSYMVTLSKKDETLAFANEPRSLPLP